MDLVGRFCQCRRFKTAGGAYLAIYPEKGKIVVLCEGSKNPMSDVDGCFRPAVANTSHNGEQRRWWIWSSILGSSSGLQSHRLSLHVLQITLSGYSLVGICMNPALAICLGVGEVCGHAVNEARHSS